MAYCVLCGEKSPIPNGASRRVKLQGVWVIIRHVVCPRHQRRRQVIRDEGVAVKGYIAEAGDKKTAKGKRSAAPRVRRTHGAG